MKRSIWLPVFFICTAFNSYSQTTVRLVENRFTCGWNGATNRDEIVTWAADNHIRELIRRICNSDALQTNFDILKGDVDNAMATIGHDNRRIIFYSGLFFSQLNNDAEKIAILAHEIGHHANSHTFMASNRRDLDELAADQFAGKILCRMGYPIQAATNLLRLHCSSQPSGSYPALSARLEAITTGYYAFCENKPTVVQIMNNLVLRVKVNTNDIYNNQYAYNYYVTGDPQYLSHVKEIRYKRNHESFPEYASYFHSSSDRSSGFRFKGYQWGYINNVYVVIVMDDGSVSKTTLKTIHYDK